MEKKKQNAANYQRYLNRGGARNPGSKEIPQGVDNCFSDLNFLITGVLDSLEREEVEEIIKKYNGKVLKTVTKKLHYVIVGDQAGPAKITKAKNLDVKMISEDDFLELLRTSTSKENSHPNDSSNKRKREEDTKKHVTKKPKFENESKSSDVVKEKSKNDIKPASSEKMKPNANTSDDTKVSNKSKNDKVIESKASTSNHLTNKQDNGVSLTALVEKYRPNTIKKIIGQTGDKSCAQKLHFWLKNWHNCHGKYANDKTKPKFNAVNYNGLVYKAALLSGPPGIGKTTTAYVVCAELGFEVIEFNASDTRGKKLLQAEISSIIKNKTVKSFLNATEVKNYSQLPKHVLLMDEVDGMAGNEDRGGMQELIKLVKSTEIPVICICNDRQSMKIKSLANYTFDLRFQKPRLEQIRAAMMSICFKENIKIDLSVITKIIQSTNQDIRQTVNHIAMLSAKSRSSGETNDKYKNLRLGPWDVVRKVFSADEHKHMSIHDKSDLFFHDYNIAPLFVAENYLMVCPSGPKKEVYNKFAECSLSLAIGDIIEKNIRSGQNWSLLPVQACFSSVIPGTVMSGMIAGQINFPSWLGKNSRSTKFNKLIQNITLHAKKITGAGKEAVNLDYLKMLVESIVRPLVTQGTNGVKKAVEIMNKYHLSREDLDSLLELTKWPHTKNLMENVNRKTKTAFTKAYNKSSGSTSDGTIKMKKKSTKTENNEKLDNENDEESAFEESYMNYN